MKKVSSLCHHHLVLLLLVVVVVVASSSFIVTCFAPRTTTGFASQPTHPHHHFHHFHHGCSFPIHIQQNKDTTSNVAVVVQAKKKKIPQDDENDEDESMTLKTQLSPSSEKNDIFSLTIDETILDLIRNNYDIGTFLNNLLSTKNKEDRGTRGEIYFLSQAILVPCILLGGIPIIGGEDFLRTAIGIGIFLGGTIIAGISFIDLGGDSLSPFPKPTKTNTLKTRGTVYGQVRHPMYTGLMSMMLGLSIWSNSINRLFFTLLLAYFIDKKSDIEEDYLIEQFPNDYQEYMEAVPDKFFPSSWNFWL